MKFHTELDQYPTLSPIPTFTNICTLMVSFAFLICLWPASLAAQTPPKIELEDSRGNAVTDELTIGRSLFVRLDDATAGETFRFTLTDPTGATVDEATMIFGDDPANTLRLFFKSNIWAEGCRPDGDGGPLPNEPGNFLGPFSSLSEASAELEGMTLWFKAEVKIADPTGGPDFWSPLDYLPITMVQPDEAVYYWSNSSGFEQCYFTSDENLYLSVYNGQAEDFESSRVFMLNAPHKSEWNVEFDFDEARYREGCTTTTTDDCSYDNGSEETLPSTVTIQMRGLLPKMGVFIAVIRDADGLQGSQRYLCDRATEGAAFIQTGPTLTENQEGWGCPPCSE